MNYTDVIESYLVKFGGFGESADSDLRKSNKTTPKQQTIRRTPNTMNLVCSSISALP